MVEEPGSTSLALAMIAILGQAPRAPTLTGAGTQRRVVGGFWLSFGQTTVRRAAEAGAYATTSWPPKLKSRDFVWAESILRTSSPGRARHRSRCCQPWLQDGYRNVDARWHVFGSAGRRILKWFEPAVQSRKPGLIGRIIFGPGAPAPFGGPRCFTADRVAGLPGWVARFGCSLGESSGVFGTESRADNDGPVPLKPI